MKQLLVKYLSVLMILCYSIGVFGYDIHNCSKTGQHVVMPILASLDCENIHPEHTCCNSEGGCCCHGCCPGTDDTDVIENGACCTDEYKVLELTGISRDGRTDYSYNEFGSDLLYVQVPSVTCSLSVMHDKTGSYIPDSGVSGPEMQAHLNIWRI